MKVGITFSAFDLLHAGHVLMLEEAKNNCDYLIVCLLAFPHLDRPNKNIPAESLYERFVKLRSISYVDEIIPYQSEEDVENILKTTNANIRFIGEDYLNKDFTGKEICLDRGIKIFYNSRKHNYSSSGLRNKIKNSS